MRRGGRYVVIEPPTFDPRRLTQAMRLACMTRRELAQAVGVDPLAVASWAANITTPRPDQLAKLAAALGYPPRFFGYGRPYMPVDPMDLNWCVTRD
jgi:transcriptional regulator with XRE-family HTH domain